MIVPKCKKLTKTNYNACNMLYFYGNICINEINKISSAGTVHLDKRFRHMNDL